MEHRSKLPASSSDLGPPPAPLDYDPALNGISGWLVVFIIGMLLPVALSISPLVEVTEALGYSRFFDRWIYATIAFTVVVDILLSGLVVFFIFRRNIIFRHLYLLQIALTIAFLAIFASSLGTMPFDTVSLVSDIAGVVIWVTYVFVSKRVRNTFIYPKMQFDLPDAQTEYGRL